MEEVWLPIFGIEGGYQVSNLGRVRSGSTGQIISQHPGHKDRRLRVTLWDRGRGRKRNYNVHRLVAATFMCPVGGRDQINHIDGDFLNNNLKNLEWCTALENQRHARETGLVYQHGEASPLANLTNEQARAVRRMRSKGATYKEIRAIFPMAKSTLSYIVNGRTYRDAR